MNPNSALLWMPPIQAAGLPVPTTIVVPYSHQAVLPIFDGDESAEFERLVISCAKAAVEIGYPVFIRTDLSSAKHSGPRAYKAENRAGLARVICATIEDNEMKFWLERNGPQAILVRHFLELEARFSAFNGLPISREWRIFSDGNAVICRHPYWPADALEDYGHEMPDNWRDLLAGLHEVPAEMFDLETMAIKAASVQCGGRWSVDLCKDVCGKWWLLDMAVMEQSWHWLGCVNGAEA